MKKLIFVAFMMFYAAVSFGQDIKETEVPSVVLNTFKQQYAKAEKVEWKQKAGLYKVEFKIVKDDHELWLDKTGKIVKHKQEIKADQLPKEVTAVIAKDYKGYTVHDPKKTDNAGVVTYKVELKTASSEMHVTFDKGGKVVSKKKED
ncbi:PepSY-like domain-containing protein [Dyadobacter sp. CY356]|uniref:PepSY-like domain-containing protein n=1 Tax=Dyadobacter sp. CY356 TaxID=2906442 RepID=UPI001F3984DB|nr:PepSY-like domain-containing protein [Dyadobacter sp. CY356]MCF0055844.1 PepSY-like domain-containing protein [Dyadobacter sp. CY356]